MSHDASGPAVDAGEASMTREQVIARLRAKCEVIGGQNKWAAKYGISSQYISDVLRGRREPGEAILKSLKLKKVVTYSPLTPNEATE